MALAARCARIAALSGHLRRRLWRGSADYLVTSVEVLIESDGALLEFDVNEASVVKTMMRPISRHIFPLAADHTK